MKNRGFQFVLVVFLFMVVGCGRNNESPASLGVLPTLQEPHASVKISIVSEDPTAGLQASINGAPKVTCTLKALKPDNPKQFDEFKRTVEVSNGAASFEFSSIPARSVLVNVAIDGGKIGAYSNFRGAKDLTSGANVVEVAGVGSNLKPDVIAAAVEDLTAKDLVTSNADNSLIKNVESAYSTAAKLPDADTSNLSENVSQVYVAKVSPEIPQKQEIDKCLGQFAMTTTQMFPEMLKFAKGNIKASLRAGVNYWSWSSTYQNWNYYMPLYSSGSGVLLAFYFTDAAGNAYQYPDSSPNIIGINAGCLFTLESMYGDIQYFENYDFIAKSETSYEVTGSFKKSIGGIDIYLGIPYKIVVDSTNPYPVSGDFGLAIKDVGACVVTFNGSCVADAAYSDMNGVKTYGKLVVSPQFAAESTITGNIKLSFLPANTTPEYLMKMYSEKKRAK